MEVCAVEQKRRRPFPDEEYLDFWETASAGECTGLMPTPPVSAAQQEAYQELSPMAIPRREPGGSAHSKGCPGTGKRPEKRQ